MHRLPRLDGGEEPSAGADSAEHPMRAVTRQIAFGPGGWTEERRAKVAALFDGLAPEWNKRFDLERNDAMRDALERGAPFPSGPCLEPGSGTGLATALLEASLGPVVAIDLSWEMLTRARAGTRVRADAGALPVRDGGAATIVLQNAFLFPSEVGRVLRPDGALVWVNTIGPATPIHLSAEDVHLALGPSWDGVASSAGPGTWAVFRRQDSPSRSN